MSVYLEAFMDAAALARFDDWLDALRSGRFIQHFGSLGADIPGPPLGRCCLGVLRDVVGSCEPNDVPVLDDGKSVLRYGTGYGRGCGVFPNLDALNDGPGCTGESVEPASFAVIADILEADFCGLLDGVPVVVTA